MLKINYFANIENQENVDALFTAVAYEKFDMTIESIKKAISDNQKVLDSDDKTANEKAVAQEKIDMLKKDLVKFEEEIAKVKEVRDNVVNAIASASKTFDNGETISNTVEATRNVLRLTACGENTRFFSICNLSKVDMMESLHDAFSAIHDVTRANSDGFIANATADYKSCNKLVNTVVFNTFSIPVENEYTKAVKIRFNGTDLGMLHESYHNGITVSVKKDAKTGDIKHESTEMSACIKKITNRKTGEVKYEGNKFMTNVAKIAFGQLYK